VIPMYGNVKKPKTNPVPMSKKPKTKFLYIMKNMFL
jgi:hypothetical protein